MYKQIILAIILLFATYNMNAQSYITPASNTVCFGNTSIEILELINNLKPVRRWEMSTTGDHPWISIANQTQKMTYINLKNTTWFRAVVQIDGEVEQYSAVALVNVLQEPIPGIISGASNVCNGINNGNLTLSGQTGTVTIWQYSDGSPWMNIPGSSGQLTQTYSNIVKDTWYKALVQNGSGCNPVKTDSFKITVDFPTNSGIIAGSNTVCKGSNSGTVTLSGIVGSIVRWEWSPTGLSPWASIQETNTSLNYTNLLNTTYYHAIVKSGVCAENASPFSTILVNDPSLGGTTTGATGVCSKVNSGEVTLTGHQGSVIKWQYSSTEGITWRDTSIVLSKIQYINLTQSVLYQAQVQSGICPAVWSTQTKVTVNPLPIVSFTAPSMPQGNAITFSNTSTIPTGTVKQFFWDFSDGSGSNSKNPLHVFDNAGIYKILLQATSDKGCVDSLSKNLDVYEVPKVDFSFSNVCSKNKASFVNTSLISYTTPIYSWDFGDGSAFSAESNPMHKYVNPGSYQVTLTVSTPFSTAAKTKAIQIYDQATPAFEVFNVCLGSNMLFLNKSTIKNGYLIYNWDFGDSKASTDLNPVHYYDTPGIYAIRLITNSNNSCGDTIYRNVTVHPVPMVKFSAANVPFGNPVQFTDSSTISSGSFKSSWDFGDGNTTIFLNPSHTYSSAGNYLATLTVESDSGCLATLSKTVWIYPKPHASFLAQSVCIYDSASFENQSTISSGALSYLWNFGDGSSSTLKNCMHKYSSPGIYQITLVATSDKTGGDTITKTIEIYPQPIAEFIVLDVCDGYPVVYQNKSEITKGFLVNYLWDFGDGTNAIRLSPIKQYLNPATYHTSLSVTSDKNCKASVIHDVTVNKNPVANFNIAGVCFHQQVLPVNLSQTGINATYEWNMGDGKTYSVFAPSHVYPHPGAFSVRLIVTDLNGCIDSLGRNVNIYSLPPINAGQDTSIILGFPIQLHASGGAAFEWYPADGLSSAFVQNPVASPKTTTTYFITALDQYGCINRDSVTISVENHYILIATNILTPDGNGKNDTWYVQNIENYPEAEVTVFNRWGTIVLHTKNYQNNWNGTNSNKDILPDGAYFYIITIPDSKTIYKGTVTILRNK